MAKKKTHGTDEEAIRQAIDAEDEDAMDACWQSIVKAANEFDAKAKETALATIDSEEARSMLREMLFTPQLLPIHCDGQQYYLYSRNRLTADPACPYQREDVCVFDKAGLVTDKKISETVYGKARLLMLL